MVSPVGMDMRSGHGVILGFREHIDKPYCIQETSFFQSMQASLGAACLCLAGSGDCGDQGGGCGMELDAQQFEL